MTSIGRWAFQKLWGTTMNKYRVAVARLETRIYYLDLEAASQEDAEYEAWEMWDSVEYQYGDMSKGECVHADEWIQGSEVLNETV